MSFKEKLKDFVKKYHYTKEETDEAISELEESVNTIVGDNIDEAFTSKVTDNITDGDLNPVTSNAVYDKINNYYNKNQINTALNNKADTNHNQSTNTIVDYSDYENIENESNTLDSILNGIDIALANTGGGDMTEMMEYLKIIQNNVLTERYNFEEECYIKITLGDISSGRMSLFNTGFDYSCLIYNIDFIGDLTVTVNGETTIFSHTEQDYVFDISSGTEIILFGKILDIKINYDIQIEEIESDIMLNGTQSEFGSFHNIYLTKTKYIPENIFSNSSNLNEVYFDNIESPMGLSINCETLSLKSVVIAHNYFIQSMSCENLLLPNVKAIGNNAFYYVSANHIEMPNVNYIMDNAFNNERGYINQSFIDNINLSNIKYIGRSGFQSSSIKGIYNSETQQYELVLPKLLIIGEEGVSNCSELECVILDNIVSIKRGAFNSSSLTDIICGNDLKNVGSSAFGYCSELKNVVLGDNIKTIGEETFSNCTQLSNINLGNHLKKIGQNAFRETNLSEVEIPESVTEIGEYCFTPISGNESNPFTLILNWTGDDILTQSSILGYYNTITISIPHGTTQDYIDKEWPSDSLVERSQ